jgi:hypothetical protein
LGGIVTMAAILLWLAPAEQTLGEGIKSVYIHVALTWTGMAGLFVAGLLGLGAALLARSAWHNWAYTVSWTALIFFAGGLLMSILAADINWGAMFWQEPRTFSAIQVLAIGLLVQGINSWPGSYRLKGLLYLLPAVFMAWSVTTTPEVLHPSNAARSSPSLAIRLTFLGLFVLSSLAGAWLVLHFRNRHSRKQDHGSQEHI